MWGYAIMSLALALCLGMIYIQRTVIREQRLMLDDRDARLDPVEIRDAEFWEEDEAWQ